jgi:hypothetical protein
VIDADLAAAQALLGEARQHPSQESGELPRAKPHELVLAAAVYLLTGLPFPVWLRRRRAVGG